MTFLEKIVNNSSAELLFWIVSIVSLVIAIFWYVLHCFCATAGEVRFLWGMFGYTKRQSESITNKNWTILFVLVGVTIAVIVVMFIRIDFKETTFSPIKNDSIGIQATSGSAIFADLTRQYKSASSIDIISMKDLKPDSTTNEYFRSIVDELTKNRELKYRRIIWNLEQLEEVIRWCQDFPAAFNEVAIGYYERSRDPELPIVPCAIVNSNTVNFGLNLLAAKSSHANSILLSDSVALKSFVTYFERMWSACIPIKVPVKPIDTIQIKKIRKSLLRSNDVLPFTENIQCSYISDRPTAYERAKEIIRNAAENNKNDIINVRTTRANREQEDLYEVIVEALRNSDIQYTRAVSYEVDTSLGNTKWFFDKLSTENGFSLIVTLASQGMPSCVLTDSELILGFGDESKILSNALYINSPNNLIVDYRYGYNRILHDADLSVVFKDFGQIIDPDSVNIVFEQKRKLLENLKVRLDNDK